jgi:tripartite-type tricarboxylate transporter receptor subunit TctC
MARVDIVQISYKGTGAAMNDLLTGQVHMMFANPTSVGPHVKQRRLVALAVTTAKPSELTPGLPSIAASGLPGYESASNWGVFVTAGTPPEIIGQLNRGIVAVLNTPDVKQKFFNAGMDTVASSPEQLAAAVKSEMSRLGSLIKRSAVRRD